MPKFAFFKFWYHSLSLSRFQLSFLFAKASGFSLNIHHITFIFESNKQFNPFGLIPSNQKFLSPVFYVLQFLDSVRNPVHQICPLNNKTKGGCISYQTLYEVHGEGDRGIRGSSSLRKNAILALFRLNLIFEGIRKIWISVCYFFQKSLRWYLDENISGLVKQFAP